MVAASDVLAGIGRSTRPAPGALFDEHSVSWRLVSRWTVLAGGQAAVLLQVAHPSVAAGVAEFSSFATDPFGRLERTLNAMLAISFGSPERREEVLAELRAVHRRVAGTRDDGEPYRAADPELQCWVWATLIDTALEVERRYVHRFGDAERRQYYLEATELARAFRVPERLIPADLTAFEAYVDDTVASLVVSAAARRVADEVMQPPLRWAPGPVWAPLRWVTVDLLPPSLLAPFGLSPLTAAQSRRLWRVRRFTQAVLPHVPAPLLANPLNHRAIT